MTAITFALVNAAADMINNGKSPWMTSQDGQITGVYVNRDAARSAKTGKPEKYNFEGLDLIDGPTGLPTGESIADAMMTAAEASDSHLRLALIAAGADAADFKADKEADVEVPDAPSVLPAPPLAPAPVLAADKANKITKEVRRASEVIRPTKMVWAIADRMVDAAKAEGLPAPTRKEVMAECEKIGIAFFTARTQYQVWKSMQANA